MQKLLSIFIFLLCSQFSFSQTSEIEFSNVNVKLSSNFEFLDSRIDTTSIGFSQSGLSDAYLILKGGLTSLNTKNKKPGSRSFLVNILYLKATESSVYEIKSRLDIAFELYETQGETYGLIITDSFNIESKTAISWKSHQINNLTSFLIWLDSVAQQNKLEQATKEWDYIEIKEKWKYEIRILDYRNWGFARMINIPLKELPPRTIELKNLEQLLLGSTYCHHCSNYNIFNEVPEQVYSHSNLKKLDLAYNPINSISPKIQHLEKLEYLKLTNTNISTLPIEFGNLNLRTLELDQLDSLDVLPECICELSSLETLSMGFTSINKLPDCIGNLKNLKYLKMMNFTPLPISFSGLESLEFLELQTFNISQSELKMISNFVELDTLNLWAPVTLLPKEWSSLSNITSLSISITDSSNYNNIFSILKNFKNLKFLELKTHNISDLPSQIGWLTSLEELSVDSQDGFRRRLKFPKDISNLSNLKVFKKYQCKNFKEIKNLLPKHCEIDVSEY